MLRSASLNHRWCWLPILSLLMCASPTPIALASPITSPIPPTTQLARTDRSITDLELAVLEQLNAVRQDPVGYANWLATQRDYYSVERGSFVLRLPGEQAVGLYEGVVALDEAITTLSQLEARPPLELSPALTHGVQDWVAVMGLRGLRGGADHQGNDQGYYTRNYGQRRGEGFGIDAYQRQSAAAIVMAWVVNDGDPLRSIQTALLDPTFQTIGIGCAPHSSRDLMCSISVAEEFIALDETLNEPPIGSLNGTQNETPAIPVAPATIPRATTATTRQNSSIESDTETLTPSEKRSTDASEVLELSPDQRLSHNLEHPPSSPEANAREIVAETNRMRSNPAAYAEELVALLDRYNGNQIELTEIDLLYDTEEGVAAVEEAIEVLRNTDPLPLLDYRLGLERAARDHVDDMGTAGQLGHVGTDQSLPRERALRYGSIDDFQGENISYQYDPLNTAQWHVLMLLIDDGVPDRGHRKALLNPNYRVTGVACGDHAGYDNICVMTYADGYTDNVEITGR